MDDHKAIARLQRGDIGGLKILVRRYQTRAIKTAILITRDKALAEDVVQAAFIRAYRSIHHFDSHRPFAPWFLRSVVNAALQAAKQNERNIPLDMTLEPDMLSLLRDAEPDPHNTAEMRELQAAVRNALDQLSPGQRAAIVMRYYFDMSEEEMAAQFNAPPGTVRWRLHAARRRLRGLLHRTLSLEKG